jgi:hypothetical protein
VFETALITGDKVSIFAYVKTGSTEGLGLVFTAGNANVGRNTSLNTRTCRVKFYNNPTNTKVQVCWIKTNRSATDAQIDAARTAGTATCSSF